MFFFSFSLNILETPITATATSKEASLITLTTTLTTTRTTTALPAQCFSYSSHNDETRSVNYGASGPNCDNPGTLGPLPEWFRFYGSSGTVLANYAVASFNCNTYATEWYSGSYPAVGGTTSGTVCYNWNGNTCDYSNLIQVTNCNGYYIYYLSTTPSCSLRFCTM